MSGLPGSLALFGAGRMGGALLEGWFNLGLRGAGVSVFEPNASPDLVALCDTAGIELNPSPDAHPPPQALVLAIKPQMLDEAQAAIARVVGPRTLVVSILAGKTIDDLSRRLPPNGGIVRAMPNIPAAVGRGVAGCAASPDVPAERRSEAEALLSAVGRVEWVDDEAQIDAVTAVSGSGPAYVFHLVECLAAAGAAAGLAPELAARLARATIEGAGEMLHRQPDVSPATLRRNVTSPGGTTAAALEILMAADGLAPLMVKAVAAARRRAGELSG